MEEADIWLILYQAALTDPESSAESAALFADAALIQYKKRWGDDESDS